jgi:hypothetical protein
MGGRVPALSKAYLLKVSSLQFHFGTRGVISSPKFDSNPFFRFTILLNSSQSADELTIETHGWSSASALR